MKTMMRLAMIGCVALAVTACKKEEAAPVADAQVVLTAPSKDDDAGWKEYLKGVTQQNLGNITNTPYLYYLPPESDPDFQAKYDRQAESAKAAIGRGVVKGNMLAFGSSASSHMADLIVAAFKGVEKDTMKGVRVLFIGNAADNERVQAAVAPAGVDYVFVEAK